MKRAMVIVAVAAILAACGSSSNSGAAGSEANSSAAGGTLRLLTYDGFVISKATLQAFKDATGYTVEQVTGGGDAGEVVNRAILTKGKPEGDVLFGVDNTFLSRALDQHLFVPYATPALASVASAFQELVPGHEATPIDYGDVCINYDKRWFAAKHITPPSTLDDLTKPAYKGRLVVENPATSSPGLAFLLATIAKFGEAGWSGYWSELKANSVKVVDGWTQAYSTEFSGSAGKGPYPIVVSYASSPPAEVVGVEPKPTEAPTASFTDGCFRQVEFAGILVGTKHEKQAQQLIDFMLGPTWQADLPLNDYVFPVRSGVPLPAEFTEFAAKPPHPLSLPPQEIEKQRDTWIKQWTNLVLR